MIHGLYVLVFPARHRAFAAATARRVVRSVPVKPIATSRSCEMSARTLPFDRSTHSSIFSRKGSISFARGAGSSAGRPRSRACAYRRIVFGSALHNGAAECATPVTSNASRISMISLSDFFTVPPGPRAGVSSQPPSLHPEGPGPSDRHVTVCPPKGRSAVRGTGTDMSVYRDLGVSAVSSCPSPPIRSARTAPADASSWRREARRRLDTAEAAPAMECEERSGAAVGSAPDDRGGAVLGVRTRGVRGQGGPRISSTVLSAIRAVLGRRVGGGGRSHIAARMPRDPALRRAADAYDRAAARRSAGSRDARTRVVGSDS